MKTSRAYQQQAFWSNKKLRRYLLAWLRQGGKTTTLADQAMLEMAEHKNRLVTFVSASLVIGSEFVEKEARSWTDMLRDFRAWAEQRKLKLAAGELKTDDADSFKEMPENVDWEAIAGALERSKFELRLKHSNTVHSRTKVIAPNIATARSWSGSVKFDEVAFVRDLRTLLAELEPIFSTDPDFTFVMATTPPADYAHYAYELLTPEDGREDWPENAAGNWFKNRAGMWVHRVTIDDAAAAGRKIYHPETGEKQTPDQARETSLDKEGWDRSNRLKRPLVGTSAVSPVALDAAQRRGMTTCVASEWPPPANWTLNFGGGLVAIGVDPATTEGKMSNPTGVAVVEQLGADYFVRLLAWYKLADPEEARARIITIIDELTLAGLRPRLRGLSVDASNERYWSTGLKSKISQCPVDLRLSNTPVEHRGEKMTFKFFSGSLLTEAAEAGRLYLPWHKYVTDDFKRVVKAPGSFQCPVGSNGEHGDTFDAVRLAISSLEGSGPVEISAVPVGEVAAWHKPRPLDADDTIPWDSPGTSTLFA